MAHIVPIETARSQRISADQSTARDPFDVVVFLNHFLESDRYPDAIITQMAPDRNANPASSVRTKQQLTMQLGTHTLDFSLGRG